MELDDLLADLQSAIPLDPEQSPLANGGEGYRAPAPPPPNEVHTYESADQEDEGGMTGYEMPHSSTERSLSPESGRGEGEDVQYSEVRKGPRYVPKSRSVSRTPPPGPPAPSDAANKTPRSPGGVAELDSLLEMLNDTQISIQEKEKEKFVPPSERVGGVRPTIKDFVDELTEVEQKVSQGHGDDPHRARGMTSSTATRELDELMADLSNFEPASSSSTATEKTNQSGDGGGGGGAGREVSKTKSAAAIDDLNTMLGSLDEDMTKRHGVDTAVKGMCAACNKPILTKVVNALGREWHKEHFVCAHDQCGIELANSTYYESNGRPYCEKDYHELFAPRCAYCNGPIVERVLRALGKTWHRDHFFCTLCGKDFGVEGFHEKDSKAFCRECYYEKFAPRCKRCEKAIMEGFITALSAQWHPECFCCKVCSVTFPRGNYFDHEGEPHCEIHYHASRGTLCASCQKPVTGKCITALGRKWHPEHFTCAFCLKLLNKGTFKEHRHNPYCQPCFIKLFG